MLVLTRNRGEVIVITDSNTGTTTHVTVNEITNKQVKLGLHAPAYVTIDRLEVAARKHA